MKFEERLPHSSLCDHVKCFWIMERAYTAEHPFEVVTPDGFIELIINLGSPYLLQRDGEPEVAMPRVILMGLQTRPLVFRCAATVKLVATRFYVWGALPFLADSARGLDNLRATLGHEWEDLAGRIEPPVREGDYGAAVDVVEDHLVGRLLAARVDLKQIQAAATMLYLQRGQVRAADLAEHCGLSSRQMQRQFQDVVGVSPKTLARSIRFETIRKSLMSDPNQSLTALAHDNGYADQAHFIRDFREFADRTPGDFARDVQTLKALFGDEADVAFLQSPPGPRP